MVKRRQNQAGWLRRNEQTYHKIAVCAGGELKCLWREIKLIFANYDNQWYALYGVLASLRDVTLAAACVWPAANAAESRERHRLTSALRAGASCICSGH